MGSKADNDKFIIENQDFLSQLQLQKLFVWCSNINGISDINYAFDDYVKENDEIMQNLSTNNLLVFRVNANEAIQKKIDAIIADRIREGKHLCEGNKQTWKLFFTTEIHRNIFGKLNDEFDFIGQLNSKMREFKETNQNVFEYLKQARTYITIDNFLDYYEKGIITDEKLDFLKELVGENPNVVETINYGICKDDIMNMNKSFLKRIAKYENESAELIVIHDNTPKLFEALKTKIDSWEKNLTPREIINLERLVLENCAKFGYELTDFKPEDIEQVLNFCARKWFDMHANIPYSENYMQECDEYYAEEFNKNLREYKNTTHKSIKNGYWLGMLDNYCKRFFGMPYNDCKAFYMKKAKSLDLDMVENGELKSFFEEMKSILELPRNAEESVISLEERVNSNPQKFQPIFAYRANDLINIELVNTFSEDFDQTAERLLNSEEYDVIDYNGQKIKQVNVTGEFSLIIRSTDTGYKVEKKLIDSSVKKTEEQNPDPAMGVKAGCLVTEEYLGVAPLGSNGVYMAYLKNNSDNVGEIGIYDINSYAKDYCINSENGKGMPCDQTIQNCRGPYAEASIINRDPDAIVIFSDATEEQKELSYKTALEYGIDILYFDKEKLVEKQIEKLDEMISNFSETGDLTVLKNLISTYETNIAGWLLNRAPEEDESCTKTINNDGFLPRFEERENKIYNIIAQYIGKQQDPSKGLENIGALREIMADEVEKYENLMQVKELSKVQMKFKAEEIIQIIDNKLQQQNKSDQYVEMQDSNQDTVEIYNVDMQSLINKIVSRDNIVINDIKNVKNIVSPQIEKEGIDR